MFTAAELESFLQSRVMMVTLHGLEDYPKLYL
jgi:hypothetical protein